MLENLTTIIVAVIGFCGSIATTIITNATTNKKMQQQIVTGQAVTDVKIEELTKEVNKHNSFAEKIPVLEYRLGALETTISEVKNKVDSSGS